jgi:coiled-coil domain-containing protein 130
MASAPSQDRQDFSESEVKFEVPLHIRCSQCNSLLVKGSRFKATKRKSELYLVGKYFATDVLEFAFRCHMCTHLLVIKTDPERSSYSIVSGCAKYVRAT